MSRTRRSIGSFSLMAMFTLLPALSVAQHQTEQHESNACPPGVMTAWEILASGVTPYGLLGASMSEEMLTPALVDRDLTVGMPDRGLVTEVMEYQPDRVLGLRRELGLSAEQVSGLEELLENRGNAEQAMRIDMQAAIEQLQQTVEADEPDTAAVRRVALRLASRRDALYAELAVNAAASRTILTDRQREELITGPCGLHHVHGPSATGKSHR